MVQHSLGQVGVDAYAFPLAGAKRAGLVPDRVGDPEPAEVVDERRAPQRPQVCFGQAETCAGRRDEVGDRSCVAEGVWRLQVDEIRDREQRVIELLAREDERQPGLGVDHRGPGSHPVEAREDQLRVGAHQLGQ